jgi:hypothetical protein
MSAIGAFSRRVASHIVGLTDTFHRDSNALSLAPYRLSFIVNASYHPSYDPLLATVFECAFESCSEACCALGMATDFGSRVQFPRRTLLAAPTLRPHFARPCTQYSIAEFRRNPEQRPAPSGEAVSARPERAFQSRPETWQSCERTPLATANAVSRASLALLGTLVSCPARPLAAATLRPSG